MESNKPSPAYQQPPLFLCLLGRETCIQSIWWPLGLLVNSPTARGDAAAGVKNTQTLTCSIPVSCGRPVYSSFFPMHRVRASWSGLSTESGEFGQVSFLAGQRLTSILSPLPGHSSVISGCTTCSYTCCPAGLPGWASHCLSLSASSLMSSRRSCAGSCGPRRRRGLRYGDCLAWPATFLSRSYDWEVTKRWHKEGLGIVKLSSPHLSS